MSIIEFESIRREIKLLAIKELREEYSNNSKLLEKLKEYENNIV